MIITAGINSTILNSKSFTPLPLFDIDFELKAKLFKQEGDLKYEYNPLRNLRLSTGELTDFRTTELNFDLYSPVDISVQPSYDGTVNLILNDDKNPPRLINSRFTPTEDKRYKIIDRKGNNDTNIYNIETLAQNTRLFKTTEKIPYIEFNGLYEGGTLRSGNYVFYFKYSDADGNESDIITESGIVSCYVGKINDPYSTRGGLANELTNKIAKLTLSNLDTSYDYLNIYYTRSTGDYSETEITEAYKITTKKVITNSVLPITITGLEEVSSISIDELNIQYNIVDSVKTQAQVQNMLFFGNVDKPTIPYEELQDLSLRIYPTVSNDTNIGFLDQNYNAVELDDALRKVEYNDAVNVYKSVGHWNKEMYRFGIVYIQKDDSLTPVFNVRGKNGIGEFTRVGTYEQDMSNIYTNYALYNNENKRVYIDYDEEGFITQSQFDLENTKGVVRLSYEDSMINKDGNNGVYPLAIDFSMSKDLLTELKKYVKGFFFVRQKRIPTILAQGISIGVDDVSFTPAINAKIFNNGIETTAFISESFMDKSNQLVNDFPSRLLMGGPNVNTGGLLCPEAQLRSEYFNEVFTAALFPISRAPFTSTYDYFTQSNVNNRHFYISNYVNQGAPDYIYTDIKLTNIEDGVQRRYSGTKTFSTRAGIPEEGWRYSWFGNEDRNRYANNLIRGSYTGFTGMEGFTDKTEIVDIHIPGYSLANLRDYFLLRANSFHPFFSMSDRYDVTLIEDKVVPYTNIKEQSDNYRFSEYRGDCYIGNYTTRIVRNFLDPDVPLNDIIVDPLTWKSNYTGYTASGGLNKDDIVKINRADVNAVSIGHWATFKLCSNINFAYRAIDESHSSEMALTGKARSFFPLAAMSIKAESKIPDSTVVNVGYNSTTSDKTYFTLPDVPYIKNLFDNRIMFSDIHINDAFKNNYRVFQGLAYKDITSQYGAIVKMFEWRGDLLVVFENGVGLLGINERALIQGASGPIFVKGAGVLPEQVQPLSTDYGSSWKDSIIKTTNYVYGIDTVAKKIWRTDGRKLETISDFKVQKFLNDNITLSERDKTPMVALRNVKTHYNAFKGDVMFTFYDTNNIDESNVWNLCYNEILDKWITRYSWTPVSSENINNVYFSFDKESAERSARIGYTLDASDTAEGVTLSDVNIKSAVSSGVGQLALKGQSFYSRYTKVYSLEAGILDNDLFTIINDQLTWNGVSAFTKFSYNLKVKVELLTQGNVVQTFYDFISTKVLRSILTAEDKIAYDAEFSTWFWKHGQAGIFDITTPILPTKWYDKQEVFEFEFVVSDKIGIHKIYNNLVIISNNAEPDSFEFEVVGDTYSKGGITEDITTNYDGSQITEFRDDYIHTYQKGKNMKTVGRVKGNMQYKEDFWNIEIKPQRFTKGSRIVESKIRDKFCIIRVRYSGTDKALITALQTLYTQSYA